MDFIIGIIGIGFVGNAMMENFINKNFVIGKNLFLYDKYKNEMHTINDMLKCNIVFMALPTLYDNDKKTYDTTPLDENIKYMTDHNYNGLIIIKSTTEPFTCNNLANKYKCNIVHNPEFLTTRTALEDFNNQKHIVLGKTNRCNEYIFNNIIEFYKKYFNQSVISVCTSDESESMKLFLNNFYAVKVQFFTEIYILCEKANISFKNVKELMLKNGWINPMHTNIPGPDGNISYGGMCFPKDTTALLYFMEKFESPNEVLKHTIMERNLMRNDKI